VLDTEALTEWLAGRCRRPYQRIDPLRADVGRVAEVMSVKYAESRRALPLQVGIGEVVIATAEPLDDAWVPRSRPTPGASVRLVVANPEDILRYTTEFYCAARAACARRRRPARPSATASFEQLVELGQTNRQLDANDQGVVQVVDWLWQYAFDQRASDIHLEPRRDLGAIRFRIDGVLHTRLPGAAVGDERDDRRASSCSAAWTWWSSAARWTAASRRAARRRPKAAARSRCACPRCPPPSARSW
jgi:general secretion pathway protein E